METVDFVLRTSDISQKTKIGLGELRQNQTPDPKKNDISQ